MPKRSGVAGVLSWTQSGVGMDRASLFKRRVQQLLVLMLSVSLGLTQVSCATSRAMSVPPAQLAKFQPGTRITVHLKNGQRHADSFKELTEQELLTFEHVHARSEITRITKLTKKTVDPGKSFLAILLTAILAGLILGHLIENAIDDAADCYADPECN